MNYNKKTVKDIDVAGKKVLLRCDFNVPQDKAPARSPRISASSPLCRPSATCSGRARRSSPARTSASPSRALKNG